MQDKNLNAFEAFVKHNRAAAKEANKAAMGFLPDSFWEHGKKAVEKSVEGFMVLAEAAAGEARIMVQRTNPAPEAEVKRKIEVEVE